MLPLDIKNKIHSNIDIIIDIDMNKNFEEIFNLQSNISRLLTNNQTICDGVETYFEDFDVINYRLKYQKFISRWELFLESQMASYLCGGVTILPNYFIEMLREHYKLFYRNLIENELNMLDSFHNTIICQVGIGEMPLSIWFLNKLSNSKIIGLDILPDAVNKAAGLFQQRFGGSYDGKFEFYCCDGVHYDYSFSNVVIVSVSVENKPAIINQIKKTKYNNQSLPVILRTTTGLSRYAYRDSLPFNSSELNVIKSVRSNLITSSLILI